MAQLVKRTITEEYTVDEEFDGVDIDEDDEDEVDGEDESEPAPTRRSKK